MNGFEIFVDGRFFDTVFYPRAMSAERVLSLLTPKFVGRAVEVKGVRI